MGESNQQRRRAGSGKVDRLCLGQHGGRLHRHQAGKGAFYVIAFNDAGGEPLSGDASYKVTLPSDVPAELFWSLTLYEAENASGLATKDRRYPSLGSRDKPVQNADGTTDLYIGPKAPEGKEANWLPTAPGRGFFAVLRLYGPGERAIDYSWKPGDFEKVQ